MEVVTIVANARGTTERRIVNDMTTRQLVHVSRTIFKERSFLLDVLSGALGKKKKMSGKEPKEGRPPRTKGKLPSWYKYRPRRPGMKQPRVVDLDGSWDELAPYVGKG